MDARMKVDRGITVLLRSYPFWGSLALGFLLEESKKYDRMATDGTHLWYNPDFVQSINENAVCTLIAHECLHKALLHNFRRGNRDHRLWNVACDYVINAYLKDAGFSLDADCLYDPKYDGKSEEEVYNYLIENPEEQPDEGEGEGGCGGLQDHPSLGKPSQDGEQSDDGQSGDGQEGHSDPHNKSGSPYEGPMGIFEDFEGMDSGIDTTSSSQEPISTPSIGQSEADMRIAISQAETFAKRQGNMPGSLERAVNELLNPKIKPEEILREFMEQCAADDFSWTVPDRRFLGHHMYLPGMESEGIREFVLAVDASGSVNQPMYDHFASIMSKIVETLPFDKVHVLFCDTMVRRWDTYTKAELPIDCRVKAGGGTRFSPVFEHLEREGIYPSGLVYLTDLLCSDFPDPPPAYKVLWLVDGTRKSVPFGEVVNVDEFR